MRPASQTSKQIVSQRARQIGFTLIEVLIALVIVSIGVLGLIGLELHNLKSSHQAYLASITSIQAMDLEERMRANQKAVNTYLGPNGAKLSHSQIGKSGVQNCAKNSCNAKQLAYYDLDYKNQWLATTYGALPNTTTIKLYGPSNAPNCKSHYYELTYQWLKHKVGLTGTSNQSKSNFQYCFQIISN